MNIEVYSDGSATTNDKPGGYGWVMVVDGTKHSEGSGHMELASNNDAELEAATRGLQAANWHISIQSYIPPEGHTVTLVSDSQLVLGWVSGKYSFRQENKMDKFKELQLFVQTMNVQTRWIRGHSGDEHNERCDKLANEARTGIERKEKKKRSPKEHKVSINYRVTADRDLISNFMNEAIRHASSVYFVGSNSWTIMVVDKLTELMDNGNYFTIEKEEV